MKIEEIRKLSDEQVVHAEIRTERELVQVSLRHRSSSLDDTSKLRRLRKEIARYQTVQREREIANGLPHSTLKRAHESTFRANQEPAPVSEPKTQSRGFLKGIVDKIAGRE